ncbi:MAG: bacteriohemerythrin [Firmicutes bacterium]|nr:bacteriohemerythrin [Bacillota bacterium]
MLLLRYRIKNFRAVVDTGWIDCPRVTAFVGSNESGKTTLLMALMKLMDPRREFKTTDLTIKSNIGNLAKINPDEDIPIDRAELIRPVFRETVFVEAVFAASPDINKALAQIAPDVTFIPIENVHITKTLGGIYDAPNVLAQFPVHYHESILEMLIARLPVFLYFKEVMEFKSDISFVELAYKLAGVRKNKNLTPRESVFSNLLTYLDIWQSNLIKSIAQVHGDLTITPETDVDFVKIFDTIPMFKARFDRGFEALTIEFRKWWGNNDITIGYDVYKKGVRVKLAGPDGRPYLLENRSTGFRRFFALFLSFSVMAKSDFDNAILLFDEAGAALHPMMQRKLAYFFRDMGKVSQILYNTHTAYMLPVGEMNDARIVYKDLNNHIQTNTVMQFTADMSNEESIFVAQASLAMHLARASIVGCWPIVLLEPQDMYYLQVIKNILIAKGKLNTIYELVIFSSGENAIDSLTELYGSNGVLPSVLLGSDAKNRMVKDRLAKGIYEKNTQKLFDLNDFVKENTPITKRLEEEGSVCFEDLMPPKFIELFLLDHIQFVLDKEFVYNKNRSLIPQMEEYATEKGIILAPNYREEMAKAMKISIMYKYNDPRIPCHYLKVWRRIMKTLLKDHSHDLATVTSDRIEWKEEYALGFVDIDNDHKSIFAVYNDFVDSIARGYGKRKMQEVFDFLMQYVIGHFSAEEALMINHNYPGFERHKVMHENFKTSVADFIHGYKTTEVTDDFVRLLQQKLARWITVHIIGEDQLIGSYIAQSEQHKQAYEIKAREAAEAAKSLRDQKHLFTLSRIDALDYVDGMVSDQQRYPVKPFVKEKSEDSGSDFILAGDVCYSIMYSKDDLVFNFILRLDAKTADEIATTHVIRRESFVRGSDWYNLIIDRTFKKKQEVYDILDKSYFYAIGLSKEEVIDQKEIEQQTLDNAAVLAAATTQAEKEYETALEEMKGLFYTTNFKITRKEIAERTMELVQTNGDTNINIAQRPKQLQLPMSLKYGKKTFALLYGTEEGVLMILNLDNDVAEHLAQTHPEICRASFPAGKNWYYLPVDGAFTCKEEVYRVLDSSMEFIKEKNSPKKKAAPKKAEAAVTTGGGKKDGAGATAAGGKKDGASGAAASKAPKKAPEKEAEKDIEPEAEDSDDEQDE